MNAFAGESKIYIFECEKCLKMLNMTRILSILLLVAWSFLPVTAQQVTVSPVPQNITWGSKAFSRADATFKLTSAQTTDAYAVQLIEDNLSPAAAGNVTIVVGKAGEEHVEEYAAKIPTRAEGYYLSVTSDRIVVAGRDDAGTYYGVQSLLQILNTADVMSVEIKDFPSCSQRGVIEGFYGNPWSNADRRSQFDFYVPGGARTILLPRVPLYAVLPRLQRGTMWTLYGLSILVARYPTARVISRLLSTNWRTYIPWVSAISRSSLTISAVQMLICSRQSATMYGIISY